MRDLFFLLFFLPMPPLSLFYPWAGVLLWGWLSLLNPHRDLWGFASQLPYNQIIAMATLLGWIASRERKVVRLDATLALLAALFALMTFSSFYTLAPEFSWPKWNEYYKTILYSILLIYFLDRKIRLHAFVWLLVGCLGFFGIKGAALFVITAGSHQFTGPAASQIGDRNHLAVAILMAVPLMNYLRLHSAGAWIRRGLALAIGLSVLAVIGTYSRGGFVGLLAMAGFLWWRSRQKLATLLLALLVVAPLPYVVPEQWVERMRTIETADEDDDSFKLRLLSWRAHLEAALDRPSTGAGIYALNKTEVFLAYVPYDSGIGVESDKGRAAHSIYFQVLGELGFPAFLTYFALVAVTWRNAQRVIGRARDRPELSWAGELARMIQVSLAAFLVAGAGVSLAFYDLYFMLVALSSSLRRFVEEAAATTAPARAVAAPPPARPDGAVLEA